MYMTEIVRSSELTERQKRIMLDSTDAVKLNDVVKEDGLILEPLAYAVVQVTTDDKVFEKLVIQTSNGILYTIGSQSTTDIFTAVFDDNNEPSVPLGIRFYRKKSKKNPSRSYIACKLAY